MHVPVCPGSALDETDSGPAASRAAGPRERRKQTVRIASLTVRTGLELLGMNRGLRGGAHRSPRPGAWATLPRPGAAHPVPASTPPGIDGATGACGRSGLPGVPPG